MAFVVSAVVAVNAAIAVTTIASVLAAVAAVGTALTVVGALVGNKDMMKIGGVLSIVGGVGGMINGAVNAAAGAAVEGAATTGATDAVMGGVPDAVSGGITDAAASAAGDAGGAIMGSVPDAASSGMNILGDSGASALSVADPSAGISTLGDSAMSSYNPMLGGASPTTGAPADLGANGISANTAAPTINTDYSAQSAGFDNSGFKASDNGYMSGNAQASNNIYPGAPGSDNILTSLKNKFGAAWDGMSQGTKDNLIKAAMSIPGGIQDQKNKDRMMDMQQQQIDQRSYGSAIPSYGILASARK